MKCKKIGELIFDYQDGRLGEAEKAELERHLSVCPACSSRLAEIRKIAGLLQTAAPAVPAADFERSWQRIAAAVAPAPPRRFSAQRSPRWALLAAGFLAFFVLGVAVARLYFSPAGSEAAAPAGAPFLYSTQDYFAALQPVLSEYSHVRAPGDGGALDGERIRRLLNNLHLLRLRAERNRDSSLLRLLDDIELVLLEIVHLDRSNPEDVRLVGALIREKGIPLKMKVFKFTGRKTVRI